MAATPQRARHCEQALIGQPLNAVTVSRAAAALAEDFQPLRHGGHTAACPSL
ncbi:hypothetical protein [Pantoea agglomerans]|uniref:hypothetical protein n=1 Tax=Enterobacter agglomerans TaxID=549 RepID=UPI003F6DE387